MTGSLIDQEMRGWSILVDNAIAKLAAAGTIKPFDPSKLSGCSYDLRAGKPLRSRNRGRVFDISSNPYEIESGECVTVETLEVLDFSDPLLFGFVVNKHAVLARGLSHPITKVDPGFQGPLALTLFNQGGIAEPIRYEQPIAALVLLPLSAIPSRIYGTSQTPSHRQGDISVASIVNEPAEPVGDAALAKMYGRPVARLYERLDKVEASVEAGLIKERRTGRARRIDIIWRFVVALAGGAVALGGNYLINHGPF
jgi:deoxycytidine triphosphate deaminase